MLSVGALRLQQNGCLRLAARGCFSSARSAVDGRGRRAGIAGHDGSSDARPGAIDMSG